MSVTITPASTNVGVNSYLKNCIVHARKDEVLFTHVAGVGFVATLDGYIIVPRERYAKLEAELLNPTKVGE